jgi:hypothetical protein
LEDVKKKFANLTKSLDGGSQTGSILLSTKVLHFSLRNGRKKHNGKFDPSIDN